MPEFVLMVFRPRIRPLNPVQLPPGPKTDTPNFLLRDTAGLSTEQVIVTLLGLFLVELADGTRTVSEISAAIVEQTGVQLGEPEIEKILSNFDRRYLLDNERARQRLSELSPRPATHAGGGYPSAPEELREFLDEMLGRRESEQKTASPASILPHIDFYRGKRSYQAGYEQLGGLAVKTEEPLTVVILGISHAYSRTPFILTKKSFQTPLGVVDTDHELVEELGSNLPFDPYADEYNHMGEHSVEFHAVLLKRLVEGRRPLKIVPILCSSFFPAITGRFCPLELPGVQEFISNLEQLKNRRPDIHFLASVDLAHMGLDFGGSPLDKKFLEELEGRDLESLGWVEKGRPDSFFATHQADGGERNYCGTPAIYTLLRLFPGSYKLHRYEQCTDPGMGSTVTICAATLERFSKE